jgi:hypothetical protein
LLRHQDHEQEKSGSKELGAGTIDCTRRVLHLLHLSSSTSPGVSVALGENQLFSLHTSARNIHAYILDMVAAYKFVVDRAAGELNATA